MASMTLTPAGVRSIGSSLQIVDVVIGADEPAVAVGVIEQKGFSGGHTVLSGNTTMMPASGSVAAAVAPREGNASGVAAHPTAATDHAAQSHAVQRVRQPNSPRVDRCVRVTMAAMFPTVHKHRAEILRTATMIANTGACGSEARDARCLERRARDDPG